MAYTIIDILNKCIQIEQRGYSFYREIIDLEDIPMPIKSAASVLAKEEERHIEVYKKLKKNFNTKDDIIIDFDIYDKASQLIMYFNNSFIKPDVNNVIDLLQFTLEFEKRNLALALSIQGLLVRNSQGTNTSSYRAMMAIINEEQKHVDNLQKFLDS